MPVRKFRWSINGGTTWNYEEQSLPFPLNVSEYDTVMIEPVGGVVSNVGTNQNVVINRDSNYAQNNNNVWSGMWGATAFTPGVDWEAQWYINKATFPKGAKLAWKVPAGAPPQGVWGYPHLSFANYSGWPTYMKANTVPSKNISSITQLKNKVRWSCTGSEDFGVLSEMWITQDSRFPDRGASTNYLFEVGFFYKQVTEVRNYHNAGVLIGTFVMDGIEFTVRQHTRYIHAMPTTPQDVGRTADFTEDWRAYWDFLIFHGVITGSEWFNGMAIGVEGATQQTSNREGEFTIVDYGPPVYTYTADNQIGALDYLGIGNYTPDPTTLTNWNTTGFTVVPNAPDWNGGNTGFVLYETNTGSAQTHSLVRSDSFLTVDSREMDITFVEDFVADKGRTAFQMYIASGNFVSQIKTGFDTTATQATATTQVDFDQNAASGVARIGFDRKLINYGNGRFRAMQRIRKAAGVTTLFYQFFTKSSTAAADVSYIGDTTKGVTLRPRHGAYPTSKIVLSGTFPAAVSGSAYSATPTVAGGKSPLTFAWTGSALPSGLSINTATGQISGTTSFSGTLSGNIRATGADGAVTSLPVNISFATAPVTFWDSATKSADVTLSEGNVRGTVNTGASNKGAKATKGMSVGKTYFEVQAVVTGNAAIGLVNDSVTTFDGWIATTTNGIAFNPSSGSVSRNGGSLGSSGLTAFANNDTVGFAVDRDLGKVWVSKNGVFASGQDPVNNVGGFALPTGTLSPAFSGGAGFSVRLKTQTDKMLYAPPTGYTALN